MEPELTIPGGGQEPELTTGVPEAPEGNEEPDRAELGRVLAAEITGPVFGLPFFCSVMKSRLMRHCSGVGPDVPQVLLHLAEGTALDLCHIVELSPKWIAAAVFRDDRSCDRMDVEFIPYELIVRVTLSSRPGEDHDRLGFDVERSAAALQAAELPAACHDGSQPCSISSHSSGV